jgi:hypothetical protein
MEFAGIDFLVNSRFLIVFRVVCAEYRVIFFEKD